MSKQNYKIASNFINRELSALEFHGRVLEEAKDKGTPLMDRLRFLAIVASNLDEFFMVRVASLYDQVEAGITKRDSSGLSPQEQLQQISRQVHNLVAKQYSCLNRSLLPNLNKQGLKVIKRKQLNEEEQSYIASYYHNQVYPVLTPMVVDQSRPFPLLFNRSLNVGVLLEDQKNPNNTVFATVQVPAVLERIVELPRTRPERCFILLEEVVKMHLDTLFRGHHILATAAYRITRNADLGLDEEGAEDILETIEESLKRRKWGAVIRLEVEKKMDERLLATLYEELEIDHEEVYEVKGPLDLSFLNRFSNLPGMEVLHYQPLQPHLVLELNREHIFATLADRDILLHHPYDAFAPVINLVRAAAVDPQVLAIKQTLYRVSGKSPIVEALALAAENGKQVTVLVEIKARFDEENNIHWARRLEQAGCHVIYGLVGLKTHGKMLLIVRSEAGGIKRYLHLSTGNYNDVTAGLYEDIGFMTTNAFLAADASAIFNMLSGYSELNMLYKTSIAPLNMRDKFISLIRQEAENARLGQKGRIIAKVNSLVDEQIIEELYAASAQGVKIDLIIRGICCLRPGLPGVSDNISVRSIVGRFLEHSRIFYFFNDGDERYYLASADWMTRNLDRRVEILFPIEDEDLGQALGHILAIYLQDTVKARELLPAGNYERIDRRGKEKFNAQEFFVSEKKPLRK
ncbi:MAG: RNA degradosome polyphosphate kinase [Methylocystaceae bacterium]